MSTIKVRFRAKVESGKVQFYDAQNFKLHCNKFEGKDVAVTLTAWRKPRSNNQNSYYWGVIIHTLANEFGYSDEEMHDTLKSMFLVDHTGRIPRVLSTTSLSTVQFEDYMSKIRQWASVEQHIYIALPNEVEY